MKKRVIKTIIQAADFTGDLLMAVEKAIVNGHESPVMIKRVDGSLMKVIPVCYHGKKKLVEII